MMTPAAIQQSLAKLANDNGCEGLLFLVDKNDATARMSVFVEPRDAIYKWTQTLRDFADQLDTQKPFRCKNRELSGMSLVQAMPIRLQGEQ